MPLPSWTAATAEDWPTAMNLMLIGAATRKIGRAVRLPKGSFPHVDGNRPLKSAASRRFVALSQQRLGNGSPATSPTCPRRRELGSACDGPDPGSGAPPAGHDPSRATQREALSPGIDRSAMGGDRHVGGERRLPASESLLARSQLNRAGLCEGQNTGCGWLRHAPSMHPANGLPLSSQRVRRASARATPPMQDTLLARARSTWMEALLRSSKSIAP